MQRSEPEVIGFGTAVRIAVDPSSHAPVVVWQDPDEGVVYRRFLGPGWGLQTKIDTAGQRLPVGQDGGMHEGLDLVMDDYGRPRLVLVNGSGLYHTRFTAGWSPLAKLMDVSLGPLSLGALQLRFEGGSADRGHVLFWTDAWDGGGRRSHHVFDGGNGFADAEHFDSGAWVPHGALDAQGKLHVVGIDAFADEPLHQFQTVYWLWSQTDGWSESSMISHEPNPKTGNGAGPVGFSPEIALDASGNPNVVYPMHADEDAVNGQVHYIEKTPNGWSEPDNLFPTNGHGGQPLIAIDHRDAKLVVSMVYDKYWAVDLLGQGFSE